MALCVGGTVWLFDANRRVYAGDRSGPLFREHFRAEKVIGETRASWLLDDGNKIDKSTGQLRAPGRGGFFGLSSDVFTTRQAVDDACWINEHRLAIEKLVRNCNDAATLKAVKDILEGPSR